jgi:hypothetical protein
VKPIPFSEFRTGLTYRDVYQMLWSPSDDRRAWRYRRRGTVLGLWHQLKQEMYARYIGEVAARSELVPELANDNAGAVASAPGPVQIHEVGYVRIGTVSGLKAELIRQGRATRENVDEVAREFIKDCGCRTVTLSKGGPGIEYIVKDDPPGGRQPPERTESSEDVTTRAPPRQVSRLRKARRVR